MGHDIFLIAAGGGTTENLASALQAALAAAPVSALLIAAGERDEQGYAAHVRALAPLAQKAGCAVLVDNRPDLVKPLGADGVHISGGMKALREAIDTLKPQFIVGTGDIGSRHEAMVRGELDVDYLMFGDRGGEGGFEIADWWAETFEVPSVYFAAGPDDPRAATVRSEYLAFSIDALSPADIERLAELVS